MTVLMVSHDYYPHSIGGTEIFVLSLSKALTRLGHKVAVLAPGWTPGRRVVKKSVQGIEHWIVRRGTGNGFRDSYLNATADEVFIEVMRAVRPNVVHVHHLRNMSLNMVELAKELGLRVVVHVHDFWLYCVQAHLMQAGQPCVEYERGFEGCWVCPEARAIISKYERAFRYSGMLYALMPLRLRRVARGILGRVAARAGVSPDAMRDALETRKARVQRALSLVDSFIVLNDFARNVLVKQHIEPERIRVIRPGLDYNAYGLPRDASCSTTRLTTSNERPLTVAFVGRVAPAKGVSVLVEAIRLLSDVPVLARIYGSGDPKYMRELRRAAADVRWRVTFEGAYTRSELHTIFQDVDVTIVPSVAQENWPTTILESYLFGIPVVAANVGGLSELVIDGKTGLLFRPGSAEDLAEKLKLLARSRDMLRAFKSQIVPPAPIEETARELLRVYASDATVGL